MNDSFREITARNDIAREVIAGFGSATPPTLAGVWQLVSAALADLPAALADLEHARAELEAARLGRANLLAAIRACLAAHEEGEADPLGYLRDELNPPAYQAADTYPGAFPAADTGRRG